jgi:hypothetical protein
MSSGFGGEKRGSPTPLSFPEKQMHNSQCHMEVFSETSLEHV